MSRRSLQRILKEATVTSQLSSGEEATVNTTNLSCLSATVAVNVAAKCSAGSRANESFIHQHRRRRKYSWSHDSDSGVSSNEGSISGSMCGSMSDSVTGSMSGSFSGSMSSSMTGSFSDSHSSAGSWHQHNGPSSLKTLRCDKIQINAGGSSRLRDLRPPPLSLYSGGQSPSLDRPQPSKTGSIFSNKLISSKDKCELTSSVDSSQGTKVIPKADILSTDNMGNPNLKLWLVKSAQLDKTNESTSSSSPPPASSSSPPD
ncbi:hypothetical protein FHG87_016948 [Trinorchestia longiramus]|nr:hypothetical protein FHG87_016948 [Trinorchestia longiramus]